MNVMKLLVIVIIKKAIYVNNFSVHRRNVNIVKHLHVLIMSRNERKTYSFIEFYKDLYIFFIKAYYSLKYYSVVINCS
jgi:hypothetical protein